MLVLGGVLVDNYLLYIHILTTILDTDSYSTKSKFNSSTRTNLYTVKTLFKYILPRTTQDPIPKKVGFFIFIGMKITDIIEKLNNKWVTPIMAIVTAIYGFIFTVHFNQLKTQESKLSQLQTSMNTKLQEKGFINNLRLTLYQEVKQSMKTNDTNQQKITLLLVDELLKEDTTFRNKLITLVLAHSNSPSLVKEQEEFMNFKEVETPIQGKWNVTVFWLEDIPQEAQPRAERVAQLIRQKYPTVHVKVRKLSKMVNSKEGYRISQNLIRAEQSEWKFATDVAKLINSSDILPMEKILIGKSITKSHQNFSIFIRNM